MKVRIFLYLFKVVRSNKTNERAMSDTNQEHEFMFVHTRILISYLEFYITNVLVFVRESVERMKKQVQSGVGGVNALTSPQPIRVGVRM